MGAGAGATVDEPDALARTPLWLAALHGHCRCIRLLLAAGGRVNTTSELGQGPLHSAAIAAQTAPVALLLAAGGRNRCR